MAFLLALLSHHYWLSSTIAFVLAFLSQEHTFHCNDIVSTLLSALNKTIVPNVDLYSALSLSTKLLFSSIISHLSSSAISMFLYSVRLSSDFAIVYYISNKIECYCLLMLDKSSYKIQCSLFTHAHKFRLTPYLLLISTSTTQDNKLYTTKSQAEFNYKSTASNLQLQYQRYPQATTNPSNLSTRNVANKSLRLQSRSFSLVRHGYGHCQRRRLLFRFHVRSDIAFRENTANY